MFKMIDDWRHAWKFTSIQLSMFAIVCDSLFIIVAVINESFYIHPVLYAVLRLVLTLLSMFARMIRQEKKNDY